MTEIEYSKDRISRFMTLIMMVGGTVSALIMLSGRNSVDLREKMYLLATTTTAVTTSDAGTSFSCERFASLQGWKKEKATKKATAMDLKQTAVQLTCTQVHDVGLFDL
mmetsp:Transcript_40886/g.97876  ORF Transcript_40886/g.97876 Transcript_40886/m.97876 type:complete len:108 (+) Transcript_40886:3948-4271(+)